MVKPFGAGGGVKWSKCDNKCHNGHMGQDVLFKPLIGVLTVTAKISEVRSDA